MAVIVNILKEVVKLKFNDKMEKLEYEVDCVVEDIRKGKSPGLNIKQLLENIEKAKKEKEKVEKTRKDAERIYDALVIAKKIYDATDKSTTIASALNPAAAAIGYATRFLIDLAEKAGFNIALDSISFDGDSSYRVEGEALSDNDVISYLNRIRKTDVFSKVFLEKSFIKGEGTNIKSFVISISVKAELMNAKNLEEKIEKIDGQLEDEDSQDPESEAN